MMLSDELHASDAGLHPPAFPWPNNKPWQVRSRQQAVLVSVVTAAATAGL